ncbi:Arsenical-resistance protein Acr3 [Candidatus Hepatincola sp. Av]
MKSVKQQPYVEKVDIGFFEKYLTLWVIACILVGITLGNLLPNLFQTLASWQYANVNFVIAVLIWLMIYPMMIQIDFDCIKNAKMHSSLGLFLTLIINWLIKPFTMALLGWIFFHYIFKGIVAPKNANEYIAGMILLGVAPCTAMVFVWSQLTKGNSGYTLVQVAINDIIMIFLFAPIATLLLKISNITIPWTTLLASVTLYVIIPLFFGYITRKYYQASKKNLDVLLKKLKPVSIAGLLITLVLLFAFQATVIINQPIVIVLIAIPLLIQSYGIFAIGYSLAKLLRLPYNIAAPSALIGTSNFFELAVAISISLFGLHSGAVIATVVGVLVEVPVMLSLVAFANKTQHWFK